MKEHNNRKQADKFAEYITGQGLRQYLAQKVKHYVGDNPTVFDGAVGSGQLEQHLNASHVTGVEIQAQACEVFLENYPTATVHNQSFFDFSGDVSADCVVMNPPFSIKFKDLSEAEQSNIKSEFAWKKSGVVDDIFVLKSLKYAKRYAFYILFPGVGYRGTEKTFRELIGNQIVELNRISNAFDDTSIDVLFLVLDKQKTSDDYLSELVDFKTGEQFSQNLTLQADENWQFATKPVEKEVVDIDELNRDLINHDLKKLDAMLAYHKATEFLTGLDFNAFCDKAKQIINRHQSG